MGIGSDQCSGGWNWSYTIPSFSYDTQLMRIPLPEIEYNQITWPLKLEYNYPSLTFHDTEKIEFQGPVILKEGEFSIEFTNICALQEHLWYLQIGLLSIFLPVHLLYKLFQMIEGLFDLKTDQFVFYNFAWVIAFSLMSSLTSFLAYLTT